MKELQFLLYILGSATLIISFVLLRNMQYKKNHPFAGIRAYWAKDPNGIDPDTLVFVCPDQKSDQPQLDKPAGKSKLSISNDQHKYDDLWYEASLLAGMEKRENRKRVAYTI
ncbi:hypothetical protein SAMN05216436_106146 [bacterium A37T11]|nr:hypothetical protein SAMN05216436_106146 [bacterium A37T11]